MHLGHRKISNMKNINIKRLTSLILFLVLSCFVLFSCMNTPGANGDSSDKTDNSQNDNNSSSNNNSSDNNTNSLPVNNKAVWGKGIQLRIVTPDGFNFNPEDLIYKISFITDTPSISATDIVAVVEHEFVIGATNRQLSTTAYNKLNEKINDHLDDGWLIYAEGNSMALAFTSNTAMDMALEYIDSELLDKEELVFDKDGVVADYVYNVIEYADSKRDALQEKEFNRIEATLGKDVSDALRRLYSMYSPEVYEWLVGLYDPQNGGFYYSNSGRDNQGYLPDIESTVQALNHLNTAGMFAEYGNSYVNAISDEMKAKLLSFAKNLQSPEDGYFYHPQWGKDIIVARRGRDLGWATQLIKALGGRPYWNTPGGVSGELGAPSYASPTSLTKSFTESYVLSVSSVKAANSYIPEHLQSLEAWEEYIIGLNIYDDPYTSGNTLAAQHNEIKAAGNEYIDYLINYLNELQNEETGFWGEGVTYVTMNGFMKLSSSYSYYNKAVPNVEAALYSTIEILLTPDTDNRDLHVCNTYNTWVNFSQILHSANRTAGQEAVKSLRSVILSKAPELINITYDKLITHKRQEGGFSYFETKNGNTSQKAPVACSLTPESDVNATCIATTGIISNLFTSLGVSKVPMYAPEDALVFIRMIDNKEPIIKIENSVDLPEIKGERGNGEYFESSNKYTGLVPPVVSTNSASAVLSNTEDKYVYFYKEVKENETNVQDTLNFELPASKKEGETAILLEMDIAFGGFKNYTATDTKVAGFQVVIYDGEELASVYFDGGSGKIETMWSTILDGENISLNENEWYNLKFISFVEGSTRAIKIYVDGLYACTVKSADDKTTTSKKIGLTLRQFDTNDWVAFDNVYIGYYSE